MKIEFLSDREREILESVVLHFVLTGNPVGSRTLAKKSIEKLSPASIRNVMADLEDKGFVSGTTLDAKELRHWIIGLDLAHDKLTIKSYQERLLIFGYFILKNGKYVFLGSLKPKQLSFVDPKKIRNQVQSSIYAKKIRRRAW